MRYAFLFDSGKCIGCRGCAMACKNYHRLIPEMTWRYVFPLAENIYPHRERAFYSLSCHHCAKPVCLEVCPTGAYSLRPDGIVMHNQPTCIGCQNCVRSCPYGAPRYNPVEKHAEKCSLCYELIDAGKQPACVTGCITHALALVDLNQDDLPPEAVQFPQGYPEFPALNPGTRFLLPKVPRLAGRK